MTIRVVENDDEHPVKKIAMEFIEKIQMLSPADQVNAALFAMAALSQTYGVAPEKVLDGLHAYQKLWAEEPTKPEKEN